MERAKDYLARIKLYDVLIDQKQKELQSLRENITRVTPVYSDVPGAGGYADKIGNTVAKIADIQEEINADIDTLVDIKRDALRTLHRMKDANQINVLYLRYFEGLTFEAIAQEMQYSHRGVCYIHGRALQNFEKARGNEK